MFKQLNVKKSLISLSQFSLGEQPNESQVAHIQNLEISLSKPFTEAEDEHLLITLHSLITRHSVSNSSTAPYSRTGEWWKYSLGFQHSDPTSDIRGGGLLALQNLIFFLSNHPNKATQMITSRANRSLTAENTYPSFPWACAGINLTRVLALEFEVILASGMSNIGHNAQYSKKTTWRYLSEESGFNRMYVCLFLLLDCLWDEMAATYMDFNRVVGVISEEFRLQLALSTSLTDLENRIHKRVQFIDPDVSDYSLLPDAASESTSASTSASASAVTVPSLERTSSFFDIEGQISSYETHLSQRTRQSQHQSHHHHHCSSSNEGDSDATDSPLYSFFACHLPSYEHVMATLVPSPPPSSLFLLPDFMSDDQHQQQYEQQQQQQHHHHQPEQLRHRAPYNIQIV